MSALHRKRLRDYTTHPPLHLQLRRTIPIQAGWRAGVAAPAAGTNTLTGYSEVMDTKIVKSAVDRTLATYTNLGLKGDEEYRHQLREITTSHVEHLVKRGEQDVEQLVAHTLRYLRSLEARELPQRRG